MPRIERTIDIEFNWGWQTVATPVDDDPDAAVRRAICPRNPTADVCRSMKDRKKVNDSKCRIPVGLGCAMWK